MAHDAERADKEAPRKPWLLEYRSSNGFILATVCVAIFTVRVHHNDAPISISFYTGLLVLGAATILFGLAQTSWVLLVSRLLQGTSAAITYTVGLALLVDTVGRDNIGQWMGTALSSSSFGLIVSPLLGGVVYAKAGYMSVFGMAMGLIVVDILMRLCMIEKKHAAKYKPVSTANGFYGTFTNGSTLEHEHSNGSAQHNKPHHNSEHAPLLDNGDEEAPKKKSRMPTILVLLSMPRLLTAIYGIFVNVSILAAFDGVLPLYVKRLFHWNSLNAGLIFMCLAIPALTGPLVGKLSDKVGPRWIAVAGCSLTAPPLILLRLVDHNSAEQKILLCALLVCCGFTLILIVSPVAADLSAVVEEKEKTDPDAFGPGGAYAQAFALFNCAMAAATLFGPVAAGALIERHGWGALTAAMGIFAFSGAIPAFLYTGGWIFAKK
ncbi:hypothetical protein OEA41_006206 [Lepraria neglecta]|uniref:Major facilitator superfamily (MFS) profile domain-containing protein n=1 Tax=Lepraria neglecta TaxID=209136 RepID=A0AAD9Z8F8_9LECA|nr:hypothetical protein OEA41_006206 [Lepraria neglecta]